MKTVWLCLLHLLLCMAVRAQGTEKFVEKPDGNYTYHYFQGTDKVSTVTFWEKEGGRKGYAVAYDRAGKEIYRQATSRMHLISGVRFSYHPDGAVSKAHYTWHPDGGIQRGGSTTHFDGQGRVTQVVEDIDPHSPLIAPEPLPKPAPAPLPKPTPEPLPKPKPAPQEIVVEAPIYRTEYFVVNMTAKPIRLELLDNQGRPLPPDRFTPREIEPGDTLKGGEFINAGHHGDPCDYVRFQLGARKERWLRAVAIDCKKSAFREPRPEHRLCYYYIQKARVPFY